MKVTLEIKNIVIIEEYSTYFPTVVGHFFSLYFLGKPSLKRHFNRIRISVFKHQLHRLRHAILSVS